MRRAIEERTIENSAILLSVHPVFADAIIAGTKTIELRKRAPKLAKTGGLVVLYATKPIGMVVATARIGFCKPISSVSQNSKILHSAAVTSDQVIQYLGFNDRGFAIELVEVHSLARPRRLSEMPGESVIVAPQSYRYVSSRVFHELSCCYEFSS